VKNTLFNTHNTRQPKMPECDSFEYNPYILGFVKDKGPVVIALKEARDLFGQLPSDYKIMPRKQGRQHKKGLNLAIGKIITERFRAGETGFKKMVFDFYQDWHRNYENEFNVRIEPFFNLNDPGLVRDILQKNELNFMEISDFDLRKHLSESGLIRKDILNSIQDKRLPEKAERILMKKQKQLNRPDRKKLVHDSLKSIRASRIFHRGRIETGFDGSQKDYGLVPVYADEITKMLIELSGIMDVAGASKLEGVRGRGVEFEFASRDASYLSLGRETGDCTAEKATFQADTDIENIYWTVFPWLLDRNYQIMKVFYDGVFIMKVHLLPLFIARDDREHMVLSVDAIETVRGFRDDIEGYRKEDLLEQKNFIFNRVIEKVKNVGGKMGVDHIYAEKFSNTKWVREHFQAFPEIFFHVNNIIKLDELEDVFYLSQELQRNMGGPATSIIPDNSIAHGTFHGSSNEKYFPVAAGYQQDLWFQGFCRY